MKFAAVPKLFRIAFLMVFLAAPWSIAPPVHAQPRSDAASAPSAALNTPSARGWVNATGNVGGDTWGYAGVVTLAPVPDSAAVIAGVSERGLWSTSDGGTSWKQLGAGDKEPIKNRPHKILFDPKDPAVFWVSGNYGAALFKTVDGGKSFIRLGDLNHADGVAVDFSDPQRKTMLLGLHEQSRSLHLSSDGGKIWQKIGDRFPENSNFTTDPIILDSETFLVNTAGWKPSATSGIYRSDDGGTSWTQVSKAGPSGTPLVAADGSLYWQALWGGGVIRSTDGGKTWSAPSKPVTSNLIELPDKRLAGLAGDQVHISADGGATWAKFGPPVPFKPSGIIFSQKGKAFYAWHLTDKKDPKAIARLIVE
jgi:photosystem II stability/assembly factor-like uncharacterized protein